VLWAEVGALLKAELTAVLRAVFSTERRAEL
jgi:hypothetical protein